MTEKLTFLAGEVASDYSFSVSRLKSIDFWVTLMMLFSALWVRMYIHAIGQYYFLQIMGQKVYELQPYFTYVSLQYGTDTASIYIQGAMFVAGTLAVLAAFLGLCVLGRLLRLLTGQIPDTVSRFILALGISAILDPYITVLADVGRDNWEGDAFRMYIYYLERGDNAGMSGILITGAMALVLNAMCLFCLYNYLITIHFNGRMLDLYQRLTGDEANFFVPHDMEISLRVLSYVLNTAKRSVIL